MSVKAGFHKRRSRSRSWNRKRAYDLVKIENQSRKRSHMLDGIGVGRTTFPFLLIPFTTPSLMIQWKLGCGSRKQKRKNPPIVRSGIERRDWFILPLPFAIQTMYFHLIISDGVISGIDVLLPTTSVWFSLDRITLRFWLRLRIWLRR